MATRTAANCRAAPAPLHSQLVSSSRPERCICPASHSACWCAGRLAGSRCAPPVRRSRSPVRPISADSSSVFAGLADGVILAVAPTHLLAIVALGLLAARGVRRGFALALFATGMLAGSLAIALAARETPSALVLLAIAAVAGSAVAAAIVPPST